MENNLQDIFVPYEESLELKQLGFNKPCFAYYDEEAGETEPYEYANCSGNVTGDKSCYNDDFLSVTNSQLDKYGAFCAKDEEGEECYERWTAVLYEQAFKFFRDKYKLEGYPVCIKFNSKRLKGYQYVIISNNYSSFEQIGDFTSYEEARLECIKRLIKIVKNEK